MVGVVVYKGSDSRGGGIVIIPVGRTSRTAPTLHDDSSSLLYRILLYGVIY